MKTNASILRVIFILLFIQFNVISKAQVTWTRMAIQLLLNTNPGSQNAADAAVIFYDDKFSAGIGNEDSYKFSNLDESLAINSKGILLSMEGRPAIHNNDTVMLQMWTFRKKSYYLKFIPADFPKDLMAVVQDKYLQTENPIDLTAETLVPFSLTNDSASYALNRFSVIFRTKTVPAPIVKGKFTFVNSPLTVFPNPIKGNIINMKMSDMKVGTYLVTLFNLAGQQVYSRSINYDGGSAARSLIIERKMSRGIYSLQLSLNGVTTSKLVLFQ